MTTPIPAYVDGDNINSFLERMDLFFLAEEIDNDVKKVAKLAALLPLCLFEKLKASLAPEKILGSKYARIREKLVTLETPVVNKALARFEFSSLSRSPGQTVPDDAATLKKAVIPCDFGSAMDTFFCERLIGGMKDAQIVAALLALDDEKSFDFRLPLQSKQRL
ncbi:hypothetical protein GE061_001676 [Apolygus lucorum]|uniref:Uncharacterized protein n=1 Tax=Apolygus lucorum TaxID=248454 RepID=A0A6A4KIF8_APOLU|nr:hypothetical protein GE061_001676 [Apolygus lucorum]